MQARVVRADDFTSSGKVTLIEMTPNRLGENMLLGKILKSGERLFRVSFDDKHRCMRLIIPSHIADAPTPPKE